MRLLVRLGSTPNLDLKPIGIFFRCALKVSLRVGKPSHKNDHYENENSHNSVIHTYVY